MATKAKKGRKGKFDISSLVKKGAPAPSPMGQPPGGAMMGGTGMGIGAGAGATM